jgi:hypothetical protein
VVSIDENDVGERLLGDGFVALGLVKDHGVAELLLVGLHVETRHGIDYVYDASSGLRVPEQVTCVVAGGCPDLE